MSLTRRYIVNGVPLIAVNHALIMTLKVLISIIFSQLGRKKIFLFKLETKCEESFTKKCKDNGRTKSFNEADSGMDSGTMRDGINI